MTNNQETINFRCHACNELSAVPTARIGEIMPCPACGLSVVIDVDASELPPTDEHAAGLATSDTQRASNGMKRVQFRVFRSLLFETWESLFSQATNFANSLPSEALINISHSAGEGPRANAVTVWYWEVEAVK